MRKTFIAELIKLAENDDRHVLLTGDLGFMVLEPFIERFPDRFFNVGVAEQNMVGIATGLAEAGFIPWVYSIVSFAALRPYEFIRNGPVVHQLPVRVVAVGGGFEYGHAGVTHHGLEDVGVMRTNPNLNVYAPADAAQTAAMMGHIATMPAPIYLRLGKNENAVVSGLNGAYAPDAPQHVHQSDNVLFLSMGSISAEVSQVMDDLRSAGETPGFAVLSNITPAPTDALRALLSQYKTVVTVEEHYIDGGLGSLIAEIIAEHGLSTRLIRNGVRKTANDLGGGRNYLLSKFGLDMASLNAQALELLQA